MMRRFTDTQVKVGVKSWFGSDMTKLQEFTQLISKDGNESEEAPVEEEEEGKEEEAAGEEEKKEEEAK